MHKLSLVLLLSFFMVPVGCGGPAAPATAPVAGKLTSANKVDFLGMGLGITKLGTSFNTSIVVAADGTFTGTAPVGDVVAYLYGAGAAAPGAAHSSADLTKTDPACWNAGSSPWKVTIPAGGKKDLEFAIEPAKK